MTRNERGLLAVCFLLLTTTVMGMIGTVYNAHRLKKAEVCNKVFVLYFKHNMGMNISLDRIYEDGIKWVDDPRYQ